MAKKTIISDFSALKGKVSFSGKTSDAKVSPKVTPTTAPKPKESTPDVLSEPGIYTSCTFGCKKGYKKESHLSNSLSIS